jgi:hypothetical protein
MKVAPSLPPSLDQVRSRKAWENGMTVDTILLLPESQVR